MDNKKYLVILTVDSNDADYCTNTKVLEPIQYWGEEETILSVADQLKIIRKVAKLLKNSGIEYNLENLGDIFETEEDDELWNNFTEILDIPSDSDGNAHTLEEIKIVEFTSIKSLL